MDGRRPRRGAFGRTTRSGRGRPEFRLPSVALSLDVLERDYAGEGAVEPPARRRARRRRAVGDSVLVFAGALAAQAALAVLLGVLLSEEKVLLPVPPPVAERERVPVEYHFGPQPKVALAPPPEPILGEIVNIPRPAEEKVAKDARRQARYDSDVAKEQRARKRPRAGRGGARGPRRTEKPSLIQSPEATSPEPTRVAKGPREVSAPVDAPTRPDPAPERTTDEDRLYVRPPRGLLLPTGDESAAIGNLQALSASIGTAGGGGTGDGGLGDDDGILDISGTGDDTLLKARAFRYWDFFERVRERIRREWSPNEVYRERDPTGAVYGLRARYTVLRVTLDADGRVVRMDTAKSCGIDFLDDEARRALEAASPFANVPKGLLDETGQFTFGFGFLYELHAGPRRGFW